MIPRTLEEIQNQLIIALAQSNSPVTDISPGSVLAALVRSLSVIHLEQDNRTQEIFKKSSLLTAEGFELDDIASSFGKRRKQGAPATGSVILSIEEGSAVIEPGTVLTDLNTGSQFFVDSEVPITLTALKQETVSIKALLSGSVNNLQAGTKLAVTFSKLSTLPITATVGFKRAQDGSYCGNLNNGLDFETDSAFRDRLINSINSDTTTTEEGLKQKLLEVDFIDTVWIKTVVPGMVEILISSPIEITPEQKLTILNYIKPYIATGVVPVIITNKLVSLNFTVQVKPYPNSNLNTLKEQIKRVIDFYLNSLNSNESFSIQELNAQAAVLASFINLQLETDLTSVSESSFKLGGLKIIYVD